MRYGRTCHSLEAFLGGLGSIRAFRAETRHFPSPLGQRPSGFAYRDSLPAWRPRGPGPTLLRPPIAQTVPSGAGISTCCPSPTPRGLGLGPTNPEWISLAQEPSGFRCGGFSPPSRYSYRHSHFRALQQLLPRRLHRCMATLPYHVRQPNAEHPQLRYQCLSPGTLSAPRHSTSELLRTLSRMAASKPTSWLSGASRLPFPLSTGFRDLSWWSGLFPSRRRSLAPAVSLASVPARHSRFEFGLVSGKPPSRSSALPPCGHYRLRLHLNAFRGEPAISAFDWHFTPIHRSSHRFATRCWVRASTRVLPRASPCPWIAHPVSGRLPCDLIALFRLAFAPAPRCTLRLTSPRRSTRRFILQKARRHPLKARLRLVVRRTGFRISFTPPCRGAFHLSLTVLVHYRSPAVFSLGGWSPQLPTGFRVSRGTHGHRAPMPTSRSPTGLSPALAGRSSGRSADSRGLDARGHAAPPAIAYNPRRQRRQACTPHGLGSLPVRSPLLRESSLFLGVLRCFSSPGALPCLWFSGRRPITAAGLPHSEILGITGCQRLPRRFRRVAASFLGLQAPRHPPCAHTCRASLAPRNAPPSPTRAILPRLPRFVPPSPGHGAYVHLLLRFSALLACAARMIYNLRLFGPTAPA